LATPSSLTFEVHGADLVWIEAAPGRSVLAPSAILAGTVTTAALTETTRFVLSARRGTDIATAEVTVMVDAMVRINSFSATPSTIVVGQSVTLEWSTTNARSVEIINVDGGSLYMGANTTGRLVASPTINSLYLLYARGDGANATANAQVTVLPANACSSSGSCGANARCIAMRCQCDFGYSGDGLMCADIDECAYGTHGCSPGATCMNTIGGYLCPCMDGYSGPACDDIDECRDGTDDCGVNATCTNLPGEFACTCNMGFDGDGRTCVDIDECATGTDDCSVNATCSNLEPGFSCSCNPGFVGNGQLCVPPIRGASGSEHSCAIKDDGTLWCWGANGLGQLGDDSVTLRPSPVQIGVASDWSTIATGRNHTCGIRAGELYCWGVNHEYQLGDGTDLRRRVPTRVGTESDWTHIGCGELHSCGVRAGELWCWGLGTSGQLGTASTRSQRPARLGGSLWSNVATGWAFTCGIRDDGTLHCAGS